MFDPKKLMDTAIDQVQKQATGRPSDRSSGSGSEVDDLIYRLTRDLEDMRRKNQELTDRLNDFERQFNHLRDIINRK
jgi:cell division septum initiation protein DivIVA